MSYLHLPTGIPDFSKAVISLWCRAPKAKVEAAAQSRLVLEGGDPNFPILQGILPLVTFGQPQISKSYTTPLRNVAVIHPNPNDPLEPDSGTTYNTIIYAPGPDHDADPSYIGLYCASDGTFRFVFHFQMKDYMSFSATSFITTKMDIYSGADPSAPVPTLGNGVVGLFPNVGVAKIQDVSYVDQLQPELFEVNSGNYYLPDDWHHVLFSFDIGGTVSIGTPFASSTCRLWYAIDDIDYRGAENMQPYRDTGGQWGPDTLDPNAILTSNAWRYSGSDPNWQAIHYYQNHYVGLPAGSYTPPPIPAGGHPFGIPAPTKYVDGIFQVEMAEFQMWTGVTLDTGVEKNRRAFVDKDGEPVPPDAAEKLLGKRPENLLHGSRNWVNGRNTGSLGVSNDGALIPSGQFTPTGKIDPYKPDPSLHGPQQRRSVPIRLTRNARL
jgi:hypothetical protein